MQTPNNMGQIFDKLNDLKEIFKFGERIVPIIQSIISFMRDVVPLLDSINSSIADTTSQMPKAQNQINNVTNATELATTEILDLVDEISNELISIDSYFLAHLEKHSKKEVLYKSLFEKISDGTEEFKMLKEMYELEDNEGAIEDIKTRLQKVNDDTYKITLSLQVQDITAQQLAAVTHLIEQVHTKLSSLVNDIEHSDIKGKIVDESTIAAQEGVHFDANARYDTSGERQKEADDVINDQKQKTSQEEIDKLFS